jgi:hypothetical protein
MVSGDLPFGAPISLIIAYNGLKLSRNGVEIPKNDTEELSKLICLARIMTEDIKNESRKIW